MDDVELLQELERVFDIQVSQEDVSRIATAGDVFDLLIAKMPANSLDRKCSSAMAFYRLRRAIHDLGYGSPKNPSDDIKYLAQGNVKTKFKRIEHASGLNLPRLSATTYGCIASLITFLAVPASAYFLFQNVASIVFGFLAGIFAGGAVLNYIDPGELPKDCITLADLARKATARSFGRLAKVGARHSDKDVWDHLVEVLSSYQLPKSEITRETFLLKSQLKKAEAAQPTRFLNGL